MIRSVNDSIPGRSTLLLAAALLSSCGGDTTPDPSRVARDPAQRGPWAVGVSTFSLADAQDPSRTFLVDVWYPARPAVGAAFDKPLGIQSTSVRDAPADHRGAPFPLIAFSHGNAGIRFQSIYLTEHLASHGYVVVAPDHLHNTLLDNDTHLFIQVLKNRPHDVSIAIDDVLRRSRAAGDPLTGMADASHIGVSGHSFGALTSLLVGGALIDLAAARAACAQMSSLICDGIGDTLTEEVVSKMADARVMATLSLAPGGRIAFGKTGLSRLHGPVMIQGGTLDATTPLADEGWPIYDGLPSPKQMADIAGAGHFSFTDICLLYTTLGGADGPLAFLATEGCGANTVPAATAHIASRTLAAAFFDNVLRGIPDSFGYLDPKRGVAGVKLH